MHDASIASAQRCCTAHAWPGDCCGKSARLHRTHATTARQVVSAADLASADVVLTTYDVLKRDVARQPDLVPVDRTLRRGKRWGARGAWG